MVLITIVTGAYKPTYNWGASHCSYIPLTSMKRPLNVQLAAVSNLAVTLKRSAGENSHIASTAISWSRHGNPLPKFPEALTQRHSSSLSVSTEQCSSFPCWLMISSGIVLPFIYPIGSMYGIYANIWVYWCMDPMGIVFFSQSKNGESLWTNQVIDGSMVLPSLCYLVFTA